MYSNTLTAAAFALLSAVAVPVDAYWRMGCPGTLLEGRLDPVVSPGGVSSHTHVILGGNGFAANMDYASTQASTCTSCSIDGDFSNYWAPKLYYAAQNGTFTSVGVTGGTVYYQQRVTGFDVKKYPKLQAYPAGFRMLAGDPKRRTFDATDMAQKAVSHVCLGGNEPEQAPFPKSNCKNGLRSQIYFPSCWNGVDLDSANHRDHMAYPVGGHFDSGSCPESHPVPMISIFYEFIFSTGDFANQWYGNSQPFVYSFGDNTGYGFHADFVNGWDVPTLQKGIDQFTTADNGCAADVYCGGIFKKPKVMGQDCTLPQMVNEEINGNLPYLPGCLTVGGTAANCVAPTTLGTVTSDIFTDMTSKGWEYLGCGTDTYGNPALGMPLEDSPTMTVEHCLDLCGSKGHAIAGLEFASQCFCGDTLPARAQPTPGMVGTCNMACKGNGAELCGAGDRLSLYQKCSGTCQNAQFGLGAAGGSVPSVPAPVAKAPAPTTPLAASSPAAAPATRSSAAAVVVAPGPGTATGSDTPDMPDMTPSAPVASATASAPVMSSPPKAASAPPPATSAPPPAASAGKVTLPSGWKDAGCHTDPLNPRALHGITFAWWGEAMTTSGCVKYCSDKGFSYAGTENGGQCFCGNELMGSQPAPSSECKTACEGSGAETCGGPARLSLYTKSASSRKRRSVHMRRHGVRQAAATS